MFDTVKGYLYIALAGAFIWVGGMGINFVSDAMDTAATVVRQESMLEIRDARIDVLESEKALAEEALRISEEERLALETKTKELRDIRDTALATGDEKNGTIAPVLGDTLRALSN